MQEQFQTHSPIDLWLEFGRGRARIVASDTTESTVEVRGDDNGEVKVDFADNRLTVVGPKHSGIFGRDPKLDITVHLPTDSNADVQTGSADVEIGGRLHDVRVKSGSGDVACDTVAGTAQMSTGSGDIALSEAHGPLRVKSGSGDVSIGTHLAELTVSTGSGDVEIGTANAEGVVKTGSGDVKVATANADISLTTGSGDLTIERARRGRVQVKGASSDLHIGIPSGTPVWTDITTVSGRISNGVESVGAPQEGQDHLEVQARTVSGDIVLTQS